MRLTVGRLPLPGNLRQFKLGALLAGILMTLAACSGSGPSLDNSSPAGPKGRTVPPVTLSQITGLPPGKAEELKAAMAVAGGERDIGIVEGQFQSGSFSLSGQFRAFAEPAGVRIIYQWQMRDADGVLIQTIDGEDNAGVAAGSDPWPAVSSAVLQRIAKRTAEAMAGKLSSMGYATRLSRLSEPPADYFAKADWNAHREIDFETLNGPGMAFIGFGDTEPSEDALLAAASPAAPAAANPAETLPSAPAEAPAPKSEAVPAPETVASTTPAPKKAATAIRAVAVIPVKGSPGNGDAELTAAMRKTLASAGWPVVTRRSPDALTIVGLVKISDAGGSNQNVAVNWEVQSPGGKKLGNVSQANNIPRGALDQGWGQAAYAVAEAAATGIFDIVKRYQ